MNRQLAHSIIACLHPSGSPGPEVQKLSRFGPGEWERTLPWLDLSGLALYFWDNIRWAEAGAKLPTFVMEQLAIRFSDNCRRVDGIAKEFFNFHRLFKNEGIRDAALKGFTKVPDYCPDANLRTQFDHDFLVEPESLQLAESGLRSVGYVRKKSQEIHPHVYIPAGVPEWPRERPANFYSARMARPIELHIKLWESESNGISFRLPGDFLDRAGSRTWGGRSFSALCDEDALLFEILHTFRHLLGNWCRLSLLFEMACLLTRRAGDARFWQRFGERIERLPRVPQAAGVVFALAARVFRCDIPDAAQVLAINSLTPPQKLWVERYGSKLAIDNFRKTKLVLFLHREFIDDPASWATLSRGRFVPRWRHAIAVLRSAARSLGDWPYGLRRVAHVISRIHHHVSSSLGYAVEISRWRRLRMKALNLGIPIALGRMVVHRAPSPTEREAGMGT